MNTSSGSFEGYHCVPFGHSAISLGRFRSGGSLLLHQVPWRTLSGARIWLLNFAVDDCVLLQHVCTQSFADSSVLRIRLSHEKTSSTFSVAVYPLQILFPDSSSSSLNSESGVFHLLQATCFGEAAPLRAGSSTTQPQVVLCMLMFSPNVRKGQWRLLLNMSWFFSVVDDEQVLHANRPTTKAYHPEHTGSHPITKVKQGRARSVFGWVTAGEHLVLLTLIKIQSSTLIYQAQHQVLSLPLP